MNKLIPIVFIVIILTLGVTWGVYQAYEEISMKYTTFTTTAITWYPLSKAYDTGHLLIGIQPVNIQFNTSATEKKFVIEIAGPDTSTHLDLAFYDTGVIDIVGTTSSGATKLADTSSSNIKWQDISYIIVEITNTNIKVETSNGTVLASVTWDNMPSTVEQIGGSGVQNVLTNGTVYVAVLFDPYAEMSNVFNSIIPVIISIVFIAIPLVFLKYIIRFLNNILKGF